MAKWSRLPRTRPNLPACPCRREPQDSMWHWVEITNCVSPRPLTALVSSCHAGDRGVCSTASVEQDETSFWKSRRTC